MNEFDLTNRVALITGGGGLLGVQHAIALSQEGSIVVLVDVDSNKLKDAKSKVEESVNQAIVFSEICDVSKEIEVSNLIQRVLKSFGCIDILINNAAINHVPTRSDYTDNSVENFSIELWHLELEVGLTGTFLMSKHVGSVMSKVGKGVILNIASDLSVIAPDQRIYGDGELGAYVKPITYSVVKTGIVGLTRYLATYWSTKGVRVNALSPGGVRVDQPEEFQERLRKLIPMNRMAEQHEYRGAIKFLCSDASSYMTGQNLIVDGGRSVW